MTEKKRKTYYLIFKLASVIISCFFPIWAVCEKFPIWTVQYGEVRSFGVGAIIILFVIVVIFRRAVFNYLTDKFNLKHAPPIAIWLMLLIGCYVLIFIGNFLRDLTVVLWMGAIGCAIGTVLTYIAENHFGNKEKDGNGSGS
jgi:NADH:ubiquinone oxidoreductase subunit 6 (subunit J)